MEKNLLNRRNVLASAGALAVAASTNNFLTSTAQAESNKSKGVIDAALDCIKTGEACIEHCMALFKKGDTGTAGCADLVIESVAMCKALISLASYKSKHLEAFCEVCAKICSDCEKECRRHENHHEECKACADSCKACVEACKALIG